MVAQIKGIFCLQVSRVFVCNIWGRTLHCVNRVKETKSRTLTCPEKSNVVTFTRSMATIGTEKFRPVNKINGVKKSARGSPNQFSLV